MRRRSSTAPVLAALAALGGGGGVGCGGGKASIDARGGAIDGAHDPDATPPPDAPVDAPPDATPPDAPPFTTGVSTLAGAGDYGDRDGNRGIARFYNPVNAIVGPDGKVYIADFDNGSIRRADLAGNVDTVFHATNFQRPFGLAFDAGGALYVATDNDDAGQHTLMSGTIWKVNVTARTATVVVHDIGRPRGIAFLPDGRLVMTDYQHQTISLLTPSTGAIALLSGAYDVPGNVDGAAGVARYTNPYGVVVLAGPTIVVADYGDHRLRAVALDGTSSPYAGDGAAAFGDGTAAAAHFDHPQGLSADASGAVYVTDSDNYRVRRVKGGMVSTVAGNGTPGYVDNNDPLMAELYGLEGLGAAPDGKSLFVADGERGDNTQPYNRVRLVTVP